MKKNETVVLEITALNSDGAGVARNDGEVVFVPYALPGETVEALIIKEAKTYAVGKLTKVLVPSPDRVAPACPHFFRCGGCDYQHLTYPAQVKLKSESTLANMRKLSGLDLSVGAVIEDDPPYRYRTKAQFPVAVDQENKPVLGFFSARSHRVIAMDDCLLQSEACNQVIAAVKMALTVCPVPIYDEVAHKGILRHVIAREGQGGLMVILVTNSEKKLPPAFIDAMKTALPVMKTLVQNVNTQKGNVILGRVCRVLWGPGFLEDELCGIRFHLRPLAFLQVNPRQAAKLYETAISLSGLTGQETVFDAYCGIGVMSLMLARKCKHLIGVEIVPEAIETAKESAELNGITNAEFLVGACEDVLPDLIENGQKPDVLVVDPPRAGCEASLLDAIADAAIQKIVYVSCNPATLARDMKILAERGYTCSPLTFVDMFAQTKHLETVVLMSRA